MWFKDYDWKALLEKRTKAVFVPSSRVESYEPRAGGRNASDESAGQNVQLLKKEDVQNFFSGYYYNVDEDRVTKPTNNTTTMLPGKEENY